MLLENLGRNVKQYGATLNARGMVETDPARDTISVTPFMTTSENGFAVTEDKQEQGEYILGAVATEDEGRLTRSQRR